MLERFSPALRMRMIACGPTAYVRYVLFKRAHRHNGVKPIIAIRAVLLAHDVSGERKQTKPRMI